MSRYILINGVPMNVWPTPQRPSMQDVAEDVEFEDITEQIKDAKNDDISKPN